MRNLIFSVLMLLPSIALAATSELSAVFNIAKCELKGGPTICVLEQALREDPGVEIAANSGVMGKSKKYILNIPSSNWRLIEANKNGNDLILIEKTGQGTIEVKWLEGDYRNHAKLAKNGVQAVADSLNAEPDLISVDVIPFKDNGTIYELCFNAKYNKQHCVVSAAAELPSGTFIFSSLSSYEDAVIEDIFQILLSVDIPTK